MPPLAPVITQVFTATPAPVDTVVATLAQPPEESDPGPFLYVLTHGSGVGITGTDITATVELTANTDIGVLAQSAGVNGPATEQTLTFGEVVVPPPVWTDDPYEDNPQLPPPTPPDERWKAFLRQATLTIVPRARYGVDFMVARPEGKSSGQEILDWNDVLLGACPTAEIETYAKQLAASWPWSEAPTP